MLLIGLFDSPFVRRVAISMKLLQLPFTHGEWSVGQDFERIRQYNPLGRVPALVLDDGEVLLESAAILDYLDELVGAERALLPRAGVLRREALRLMALAIGAAEKGVAQVYERAFRPEDKRHAPWVARCRTQMLAGLNELERYCATHAEPGLINGRFGQADITVACVFTFLTDALPVVAAEFPALRQRVQRCESMLEFQTTYLPFYTPQTSA